MTADSLLLSIIVPTKDRYDTLLPVVTALLKHIRSPDVEIVVQDNSTDNSRALQSPELMGDPRVIYRHSPIAVSIVDNTIACLRASRGDYLTFIGDDDLVSPHIVDAVRQLQSTDFQCMVFTPARYWWSTVDFAAPTRHHKAKAFWLPTRRSGPSRVLETQVELDKFLASGSTQYLDLPRFYHGVIRRDALQAIERSTGTLVPGSSPDMAFSVALSLVMSRYVAVHYPLTVYGASRVSGGGRTAAKRHHGRIEDQAHLPAGILERWDRRIPRFWSEQTIYPQTTQEVLTCFGSTREIAYEVLYASLIANERHLIMEFFPVILSFCRDHPTRILRLLALTLKKVAGRLYRHARANSAFMPYELKEFDDVEQAMQFLATLGKPALELRGSH